MSFKREGNDTALLNNLRKHRVDELLSLHIPDDEAILLKNGRYSCSVCSNRPIFDTISVLANHRKGKKHLYNLTKRLNIQNSKKLRSESITQPMILPHETCLKTLKRAKPTRHSRKQTIIVKEKVVANTHKAPANSTKLVIRDYVSSIKKKRDFTSFVEKVRNNVSSLMPSTSSVSYLSDSQTQFRTSDKKIVPNQSTLDDRAKSQSYLNLREKGWIKNDEGVWIKEDGVEFDSDEELPIL